MLNMALNNARKLDQNSEKLGRLVSGGLSVVNASPPSIPDFGHEATDKKQFEEEEELLSNDDYFRKK